MANEVDTVAPPIVGHGASRLSSVEIDSFNVETKNEDGFIGDRANTGAFRDILDDLRKRVSSNGEDPLGKTKTADLTREELDEVLTSTRRG